MHIAINTRPIDGPWGGGNQFVGQLVAHLRARGHRVSFRLWPWTQAILLVAPKPFQNVTFDVPAIARFMARRPSVRCVHRINQTNEGRGVTNVDGLFQQANAVANSTVFISEWVRDYFRARWFDAARPHSVIHNGADDTVFFPGTVTWTGQDPLRVVTHHWSVNPNKGFATYAAVDQLIASGALPGFSLTVIGRWPEGMEWRAAATEPALAPPALGSRLRAHHLYLTAAKSEAGGMHHIEGAQCGLPLVYHEDGGGIVELGRRYGVPFRDDVRAALLDARDRYADLRRAVLAHRPSGTAMCDAYEQVLTS